MKKELDELKDQIRQLRRLGDRLAYELQDMMDTHGWDEDAEKAIEEWEGEG